MNSDHMISDALYQSNDFTWWNILLQKQPVKIYGIVEILEPYRNKKQFCKNTQEISIQICKIFNYPPHEFFRGDRGPPGEGL